MNLKQLFEYQARAEMFGGGSAPPIYLERTDTSRATVEEERTRSRTERAMDQALADSFPASDPPPWTLGVAQPPSKDHATIGPYASTTRRVHNEATPRETINGIVILESGSTKRSPLQWLLTLTGATGLALLVPIAILLVGLPVALGVRGIVEAVAWLAAFVSK